MNDFNRNEKQQNFNQIKGVIAELNPGDKFCNITLLVGHEKPREVNLIIKRTEFEKVCGDFKIEDRVAVKFYLSSRHTGTRWNTMANVLSVENDS